MIQFQINDMTCGHCAAVITKAVKALDGGAGVEIDLDSHSVRIRSEQPSAVLAAAIREAGYTPQPA